MNELVDLQSSLGLSLLQRITADLIMSPLSPAQQTEQYLPDGRNVATIAEHLIKPNDRLTSIERIEIYNRQYWFRLIDCLYDDFPGLRAILGERRFYDLCVAYLLEHPSTSFSLRDLGSQMVSFIDQHPQLVGRRHRAAKEMSRFELAQVRAFDEACWPLFDPRTIADEDPSSVILHLQPYISLLDLSYPLDDLLVGLKKEPIERTEAQISLLADGANLQAKSQKQIQLPRAENIYLVVHRLQNSLYYKRISRPAFVLLSALNSGSPVAVACQKAELEFSQSDRGSVANSIAEWFRLWSSLGWFGVPPAA